MQTPNLMFFTFENNGHPNIHRYFWKNWKFENWKNEKMNKSKKKGPKQKEQKPKKEQNSAQGGDLAPC